MADSVTRRPFNNFRVAITDPCYFVGHARQLAQLCRSALDVQILLGGGRMGKTSTLRALEWSLFDPASGFAGQAFPSYVNLAKEQPRSFDHFRFLLIEHLREAFKCWQALAWDDPRHAYQQYLSELGRAETRLVRAGGGATEAARVMVREQFEEALWEFIEEVRGRRFEGVCFLLDEAEFIIKQEWGNDACSYFRGLKDSDTALKPFVGLLFSGYRGVKEYEQRVGSPLYNISSVVWLGPLTEEESHRLISVRAESEGLSLTADEARLVSELAGGHPHLLQQTLNTFFDGRTADSPVPESSFKLSLLRQYQGDFKKWWNANEKADGFGQAERAVYRALCECREATFETLAETTGRSELQVLDALQVLVGTGVVRQSGDDLYAVGSRLFEEWAAPQVSPDPPEAESGGDIISLSYAVENKFPYPIARPFYQLRGVGDWLAEIPQLANVLGVTLEHTAILALAEYLSGHARDDTLNATISRALQTPPSHGTWAGLTRETLAFLRASSHEMFTPELSDFYFPVKGGQATSTLKEIGDELVQMRNDLIKRSAGALPARSKHQQFKRRLLDFLRSLAFLKDYPLVSVKSTQTQDGIKTHVCHLNVGFHDNFDQVTVHCDLDLESTRVAALNPRESEILYLHPFYLLRACAEKGCGVTHLFSIEKVEKRHIEYAAAGGHRLREQGARADLELLLSGFAGGRLRQKAKYLCLENAEKWHELPAGQRVNNRYEITRHLRRGGMADIYKVRELDTGEERALKLLPFQLLGDRTVLRRFKREALQARVLDHPNITRVLDYGEDLVDHYLVMELADGWETPGGGVALDVGELPKPLDEAAAVRIVKQACAGLDYVHARQIIHRDIKPGNLLLFAGERVKLADFGIARSRELITLTLTGLVMGTPEYMSPEQADGRKDLSRASDLYSLGVVMYELLTGRTPFKRATPLATALAHLREPAPPPRTFNPKLSDALQAVVMRCLEKSPGERFASARELYDSLGEFERRHLREIGGPSGGLG